MVNPQPNIVVPVDLTNPGQFFACCGLLELADRLWPGAEGWFEGERFCLLTPDENNHLPDLLTETKLLNFEVNADAGNEDEDLPVNPVALSWSDGKSALVLDWWADKSIKTWAGSMNERVILRAMLDEINPANTDPFADVRVVLYSPPGDKKAKKKKEPFYFDPRRGGKSHPLDCGFSPDAHSMPTECCPALEALCFIGLQRARPASLGHGNHCRYNAWSFPLPANVVAPVVCGLAPMPGLQALRFWNFFRTDQRKHKSFSMAQFERSTNA